MVRLVRAMVEVWGASRDEMHILWNFSFISHGFPGSTFYTKFLNISLVVNHDFTDEQVLLPFC